MSPELQSLLCDKNATIHEVKAYKARASAEDFYSTSVVLVSLLFFVGIIVSICVDAVRYGR